MRLFSLFALIFLVGRISKDLPSRLAIFALILMLPVFSALTGHAAAQPDHTFWRLILVVAHSIAVGIWTGGLWRLHQWLSQWLGHRLEKNRIHPEMSHAVVQRFSHFAMTSTGVIAITGIAMAYWAGVSLLHPLGTEYGKLVVGKDVRSDSKGIIKIKLSGAGKWYAKFINMVKIDDPKLNYESKWATLTFEIR